MQIHKRIHLSFIFYSFYSRYSNAVQDDLWETVGKQAKKNQMKFPATVKQIMDTWTLKKGT